MTAQTVLLDFSIDPSRIGDKVGLKDTVKLLEKGLLEFFPQLKLIFETSTSDGHLCVFSQNDAIFLNARFFNHGIIAINIEYFKDNVEQPFVTFDLTRQMRNHLEKVLNVIGHAYPAIHRSQIRKYFPSSDERILEYDIDKVIYEGTSPFQKIQIVHSKSLGNMLVLDELQNIAESDLIYTETLMQRGIENYEGKEICILGGGDGALLYELLKEKPKFVTMLEIDEMVMQVCNKYLKSICGDVLELRKSDNFEIIVDDCMIYLDKFIKEGKKFDYVFGDLTDIPISDTPTGEVWNFFRSILEHSFKILKPTGKYLTHGNGANRPDSLSMFEEQLEKLEPKVKFTRANAFVPSFMEDWVFYQITFDDV
ncbi:spermine synthase isoform X2 [Contarinia nasturtii]|uniref:spermine synthase isoform X2 n=1 Tax=Contarinia nasturtii TaxID=265458 RepID=UPI0012D3FED6|nr:spermine synthase isoform X2 [Contarinia nasturtii]